MDRGPPKPNDNQDDDSSVSSILSAARRSLLDWERDDDDDDDNTVEWRRANADDNDDTDPTASQKGNGTNNKDKNDDDDDEPLDPEMMLFLQKWNGLDQELSARLERLTKIVGGRHHEQNKSPWIRHLRRREAQASMRKREAWLLEEIARLKDDTDTDDTNNNNSGGRASTTMIAHVRSKLNELWRRSDATGESDSTSCLSTMWDALVFECHSTLPASLAMLVHCIALAGILELVCECVRCIVSLTQQQIVKMAARMPMTNGTATPKHFFGVFGSDAGVVECAIHTTVCLVGLTLVRSTGYLYWWLPDAQRDALKFDYHNRIRLAKSKTPFYKSRYPTARILLYVKQRPVLQVTLFMLGYYMVYSTSNWFMVNLESMSSQQSRLTRFLPSATFSMEQFQTVESAASSTLLHSMFLCDRTCDEELDRRQEACQELHRAERAYTKQVLSAESYFIYWAQWAHGWGGYHPVEFGVEGENLPLFDDEFNISFAAIAFACCLLLGLRMVALLPA